MRKAELLLRRSVKSVLYPLYERRLVRSLDFTQTPQHVGVIIDGNRRWAKENPDVLGGTSAARGHRAGAQKIIEFLGWCEEAHVKVVTIWFLSTENFNKRSEEELKALLAIIGDSVDSLKATGRWNVKAVGSLGILPDWLREKLETPNEAKPDSMVVNMAIGYGGRTEIVDSVKRYLDDADKKGLNIQQAAEGLSADAIANFLYTAGQPDPELLIRTSGEQRLGGFLLWQSAHSEFYFCEAYWPDFRRVDFLRALRAYSLRHRRFGA
jgi:short-chain Z-isoprenyl diphosphate synthase